ncbi:protein Skeletor, isoforms D/E isoform X1 [Papilio machaon]|uniref:protein Skeletor, isoforms D/E isoform X1 n=2 Tax=Papilio machaon TaxID=76193 RepID=UPI001E6634D0|nr:protein Skeletor, isoforms D/E isoform X1 [Papilio machaon]
MHFEVAFTLLLMLGGAWARYLGKEIGALSQLQHGVRGELFAVDSRTLYLHDFHYDGAGPAAYFFVGTSKAPSSSGVRLRDERGGSNPLRAYRGEGITLSLPDGHTLRDLRWFSVWCDEYAVNFGSVNIPSGLEYPRPARLGALRGVHGVRSEPVLAVDAQTLLVPNFSYDGEAPDAKFWVGRGENPSPQGIRIPDENGKEEPLRKYDNKTIVLTLPGELTVFDIGHFGVWCEAFTVDFGHIVLPRAALANVPPSLKMLGVSPQSKLNCEVLLDELAFEVRWAVAGDSIVLQLVAKLEDGDYMSFGISGHPARSQMVGGDVAVVHINQTTLRGCAEDYYLDAKSQCAGDHGSCPDERLAENTNSVRLLNAALVNGYSIVTYQRPLRAVDRLDLPVLTNSSQPVIWAIGPLNGENEVSYHHHYTKGDKFIEFGRPPVWNCPMPDSEEEHRRDHEEAQNNPRPPPPLQKNEHQVTAIRPRPVPTPKPVPKVVPWEIPGIQCYEPPDGVFYAQMGPTGGKQGYSAITGHVGWGIAWYINGLLVPEVTLVRGRKYTFVVEGGSDPAQPARYHPFYITNDPVGGYYHKSDEEKKGVEIYAGVRRTRTGELIPTGVGRLCNWTPDASGPEADDFPSFGAYQRSLTLVCEEGSPGVVTWTPDRNTPDTVYYQCFTHRHLGWKIRVVDECDLAEGEGEESRLMESVVLPDMFSEESAQVPARLALDDQFLDERKKFEKIINMKKNYNNFSSPKDVFSREVVPQRNHLYSSGTEYELPISKLQIKEVIEAVESLEEMTMNEMKRNGTQHPPPSQRPGQYQVYEDTREAAPEQPVLEGDEYVVQMGLVPESFLLPPARKPVTLQSVMRPGAPSKPPPSGMRPHFRRPIPPEITFHRPGPHMNQKGNNGGYPLAMPQPHPSNGIKNQKPFNKFPNTRLPPMSRPPLNIPPMKSMPPLRHTKPSHQTPQMYHQSGPKPVNPSDQSIVFGKLGHNIPSPTQSQTLSLGKTDIIANQVVKSQITLPGTSDSVAQFSTPQLFSVKPQGPGQIIFGKPVENPVPLDQEMMQTKQQPTSPKYISDFHPTPTSHINTYKEQPQQQDEIKSSDFIGQSAESSTLAPAINTGFKPDSIVIESGFKPIIREPLMAGEDRIADSEVSNVHRREDTDVLEDYEDSPQYITNQALSLHIPSDKLTETFEPMFIPSPPDHLLSTNDTTKEIFPKNHAKEDRPHPVYVKTESELNALFSKKNMNKVMSSDLVMESDRVSPQYLPPDPKLPKEHSQKLSVEQTFTTYDGKTISAATLTSLPDINKVNTKLFSSKLPANTELLLKMPQFGPFKGEIPPPVDEHIKKDSLHSSRLPVTHLKLISSLVPKETNTHINETPDGGNHKINIRHKNENSNKHSIFQDTEYDSEENSDDENENKHRSKRNIRMVHLQADKETDTSLNNFHLEGAVEDHSQIFVVAAAHSGTRCVWTVNLILLILYLKLS